MRPVIAASWLNASEIEFSEFTSQARGMMRSAIVFESSPSSTPRPYSAQASHQPTILRQAVNDCRADTAAAASHCNGFTLHGFAHH